MGKKRKLLKRVLSGSKNIRFDEFTGLIEALGFALERISGSHHIFSHPAVPQTISAQPDQNGQAKPYQVRQLTKLIEKYALKLTDDSDTDPMEDDGQ